MSSKEDSREKIRVGRCYTKAPIIEAVCEFRFAADSPWDMTIPGMVYQKLEEEFPDRRQKKQFHVDVSLGSTEPESKTATSELTQFYKEDETALFQVGEHLLTINKLKPYGVWEDFRDMIQEVLAVYRDVAQPVGLTRIGLRYINIIQFNTPRVTLEDYFKFYPSLGDDLPEEFANFITGVDTLCEDGRDLQRLVMTKAGPPAKDSTSIMLDIDYGLTKPTEVPMDDAIDWVETAHGHVESTFEACITDALRAQFEEE